MTVQLKTTVQLLDAVFARPRMFCAHISSFKDVLLFAEGVCHGLKPPHASGVLAGFDEYLASRFHCAKHESSFETLQAQFGHLPLAEACEAVREVLRGWREQVVTYPFVDLKLMPPTRQATRGRTVSRWVSRLGGRSATSATRPDYEDLERDDLLAVLAFAARLSQTR